MKRLSYRDTWVEVSLAAIRENTRVFKQHMNKNSKLLAVVKADGYGHGAEEVGRAALAAGADRLGVALLDEAIELRKAGIEAPILVLGYTKPEVVKEAIINKITLTVYSKDVLDALVTACEELQQAVKVHLKIDTGMRRVGVQTKEEALELVKGIDSKWIELEGIYTHFADADNVDETYTRMQFARFLEVTDYLAEHGYSALLKHCCNTAATICFPEMHLDMCRVGIGMYGLYPAKHMKKVISLTQAMTFQTKAVLIKEVEAGESISYGCTYQPKKKSLIATLSVGYADGLSRQLSNRGEVTIRGQRVPIVGRICMDQTMVDVTSIDEIQDDDVITIFGEEKEGYIPLDEIAEQLQTIHYEIICLIGKRVPRVYIG